VHTEIIDAKKIGSLLNGIGESLLFRNGRLGHWDERFHAVNANHTRLPPERFCLELFANVKTGSTARLVRWKFLYGISIRQLQKPAYEGKR
jgi:hypothetical protein